MIGRLLCYLNGWKAIEPDVPIPAKYGQRFDVRFDDGDEMCGLIRGRSFVGKSKQGKTFEYSGGVPCFCMENTKTNKVFGHQSHYRLYVIDPKQAQIGQTVAQFRNIAKQAEREGRVTVPAGKKRKRQKEPS